MAVHYRTQGFIFKKDERAESDQILSVFTKDFGRLELKAKAIRKIASKLRPDIDMFYLSEIEFIQGKNNKTLTDATKIEKFDDIAKAWCFVSRSDFKNYDSEIEKFIDWIGPHLDVNPGEMIGYYRYEEFSEPTIIYAKESK